MIKRPQNIYKKFLTLRSALSKHNKYLPPCPLFPVPTDSGKSKSFQKKNKYIDVGFFYLVQVMHRGYRSAKDKDLEPISELDLSLDLRLHDSSQSGLTSLSLSLCPIPNM